MCQMQRTFFSIYRPLLCGVMQVLYSQLNCSFTLFFYLLAAFLIAYLILQILIGKPMYMMELVMGQFSGSGPTAVWAMNPSAKGIYF